MRSIFILMIFLVSIKLQSQNILSPSLLDNEIKMCKKKLSEDPKKTLESLEKIRKNAYKIDYKLGVYRSTYLIIHIYISNFGDFNKVIKETKIGERIAKDLNDNEATADMLQLRGISYIELGMNDVGLENLLEALKYATQIDKEQAKHKTLALIYDNIGGYYDNAQDLKNFEKYKRKSLQEITQVKELNEDDSRLRYRIIATQNTNIGHLFHKKKQLDSAKYYFLKAYNVYNTKFRESNFREKIDLLSRLSRLYYDRKDFSKSLQYAHLGLSVQKEATTPALRKDLYEILYLSFLESKNTDSASYYSNKYTLLNDSINIVNKKNVNQSLERVIAEKDSQYLYDVRIVIVISILAVVIVVILVVFYSVKSKRKIKEKYEILIHRIENDHDKNIKLRNMVSITDQTLEQILKDLDAFEQNKGFTNKDTSLPKLSHQLNTNTTYLSEVIKQHKKNNFNGYINNLRIKYIIRQLYENPIFREYKISYLADKSGFSSREVFTTTFKKETGISPSYFIKELKTLKK